MNIWRQNTLKLNCSADPMMIIHTVCLHDCGQFDILSLTLLWIWIWTIQRYGIKWHKITSLNDIKTMLNAQLLWFLVSTNISIFMNYDFCIVYIAVCVCVISNWNFQLVRLWKPSCATFQPSICASRIAQMKTKELRHIKQHNANMETTM